MENEKITIIDKIKMALEDFDLKRSHKKFLKGLIMKDWQVVWGTERDRKMTVRAMDILESEIKGKNLLIEEEKAKPKIDLETIKTLEGQKEYSEEELKKYRGLDIGQGIEITRARTRIMAVKEFMSQLVYKRDKCRLCGKMINLNSEQVVWPEFAKFQSCHFACASKKEKEINDERAKEKEAKLKEEMEKTKKTLAEMQSERDK